ncbi:hypothetical protein H4582DRAFT_2067942 [Lactarius indigo]|nr:hypothetical protein H4582DRAFT_2067942 [Lactarius indigo]
MATSAVMYHIIPILQVHPVCLSATTTQRVAERGVHPKCSATASTIVYPIPSEACCKSENKDYLTAATSSLLTHNNQANCNSHPKPFERKRKLPESEAEANTCHAKWMNMDTNLGQTRTAYKLNLPAPIIKTAGMASELAKTKDNLHTPLIKNEALHTQIHSLQATKEVLHATLIENEGLCHDLQARFGQIQDHLGNLQDLADMVKSLQMTCLLMLSNRP